MPKIFKEESGGWHGILKQKKVPTAEIAADIFRKELEEDITVEDVSFSYWGGNNGTDDYGKPWVTRGGWMWQVDIYDLKFNQNKES